MTTQLLADVNVLNYKLDSIRNHCRKRLETIEGQSQGEIEFVLKLISKWEEVPAGWSLTEPFVPETNKPKNLQHV